MAQKSQRLVFQEYNPLAAGASCHTSSAFFLQYSCQILTSSDDIIYGSENEGCQWSLKLSDAFMREDKSDNFEWTADVINMNPKCISPLQKKCKPLYDYIRYVYRIKESRKSGMGKEEAVDEAVKWAIKENLLDGFFRKQKAEVTGMSLTEFDEEEFKRVCREESPRACRLHLCKGIAKTSFLKPTFSARNLCGIAMLLLRPQGQGLYRLAYQRFRLTCEWP